MKIWAKSFCREVWHSSAAGFLILLGIAALVLVGKLLSVASGFQMQDIFLLTALQLIKPLPQIITLSMFLAMIFIFNRMVRKHELNAWTASGLRLRNWFGAVLAVSLPTSAVVGLLALEVVPWSMRTSSEYQRALASDMRLEHSLPGRFGQAGGGAFVYYLGTVNPERTRAGNVFMAAETGPDRLLVVQANSGETVDSGPDGRSLELSQGTMYSLDLATGAVEFASFEHAMLNYGRAAAQPLLRLRSLSPDALSAANPGELTELYWRLGFPFATLMLGLFALPWRRSRNPASREYSLLLAGLGYWLYYSFTGMIKDLGIHGSLAPWQAGVLPHALPLLAGLALLVYFRRRW